MLITTSWYASVASAALAYHFGGFILFLIRLPGYETWSLLAENLYIDSLQALAFVALGAVCRILSSAVRRSLGVASRVVIGDVCVVLLAVAGLAAVTVPLDSSGAAFLAILLFLIWGLPAAGLLSAFSVLVERHFWLQVLLAGLVVLNSTALLVGLALKLTA